MNWWICLMKCNFYKKLSRSKKKILKGKSLTKYNLLVGMSHLQQDKYSYQMSHGINLNSQYLDYYKYYMTKTGQKECQEVSQQYKCKNKNNNNKKCSYKCL